MRHLMFLLLFLAGCAMFPRERWHTASTGKFTFSLPPGLHKVASHGFDAPVIQYTNQDMIMTFDGGAYAGESLDSLGRYPHYASVTQQFGGGEVQIVTFDIPPGGDHRFDYAIAASYLGMGLSVYAHCRTKEDYTAALKIFQTVRRR